MSNKQYTTVLAFLILILATNAALAWTLLVRPVEPVVIVQTAEPVATEAVEKSVKELQNGRPLIYVGMGLGHPVIALMMQGFLDACADYDAYCVTIVIKRTIKYS